jgi:hypothetical protein
MGIRHAFSTFRTLRTLHALHAFRALLVSVMNFPLPGHSKGHSKSRSKGPVIQKAQFTSLPLGPLFFRGSFPRRGLQLTPRNVSC